MRRALGPLVLLRLMGVVVQGWCFRLTLSDSFLLQLVHQNVFRIWLYAHVLNMYLRDNTGPLFLSVVSCLGKSLTKLSVRTGAGQLSPEAGRDLRSL